MAKQSVDNWQRPPSRGNGLLPLPPRHSQSAVISPSGDISQDGGASTALTSSRSHHHHQQHAYQGAHLHGQQHLQSQAQSQPHASHTRKKGTGGGGGEGSGGPPGRGDNLMSPPGAMNNEHKDRHGSGGRKNRSGSQGVHLPSHGASSDVTTTVLVHQHDLETLESCSRNPLLCLICNNVYEDPRLLSCFHSFCAKCLQVRDAKLVCPLCGKPTALKDGCGPPTDHLLRFLLQTSPDIHPSCANCDNKIRTSMYYCNTCGQVLCNGCREETHRAKMFSTHDIVPVSKYTKETPKKCSAHGEQFIMFSNSKKQMLCINCYRDTAMDSRLHCVDLETAYSQGCRKLDRAVVSLRDLQMAVRDGITILKNTLEEIRRNSDSEKSAVNAVCQTILDALTKTQENLLKDTDGQMEGKDKVIRGQLCQLRSVLPIIKLHLTMCATIASATNKYDFLDLAYPLIDRLTAITHMGYPIRPGQSSQIKSTYKSEIARTLEPWVAGSSSTGGFGSAHMGTTASIMKSSNMPKDYSYPSVNAPASDLSFGEPTYSQYYPMSRSNVPITPVMGNKSHGRSDGYAAPSAIVPPSSSGRKTPVSKQHKSEGTSDDHFAAHCRSFNAHVIELNQRLSRLKEQVQDLHRDVTLQRGNSHSSRADNALREGLFLEDQLERRHAEMERIRKHLESHWNENVRQIRIEQEVFQSQMNDLVTMKAEVKQLSSLLQQIQAFLKSLISHPPPQPPPGPGGGGGAGSGVSRGGGGGNVGFGGMGKTGSLVGTSSVQGTAQSGQTNRQQQHAYHLTSAAPETFSSRAESGSQVTPSLGDLAYPTQSQGRDKFDGNRFVRESQSGTTTSTFGTGPMLTSGGSTKQPFQLPTSASGFTPRPCYPPRPPNQTEMEYIQVDTSYCQSRQQAPQKGAGGKPFSGHGISSETSMKKGVLSQLIDKVRSKDDRKKSSASGISSSSSGAGGGAQHPHPIPTSTLSTRRALTMYDAQCQFGLDAATSAVTALALPHPRKSQRSSANVESSIISQQRHESRPTYTRTKSFVKSKSDDERPPSKLSQQLKARSAGQLETESLLRSLSSGSKDASRILELYQSLSKTIIEQENQHLQRQAQAYSQQCALHGNGQHYSFSFDSKGEYSPSYYTTTVPPRSSSMKTHAYGQSNSLGRTQGHSHGKSKKEGSLTASEDDYQQIPLSKAHPIARSHSAPPRKPAHHHSPTPGSSQQRTSTEVKVYVHGEPVRSTSDRHPRPSSPSTTALSKSLEESHLYGYLSQQHSGGLTSSSSGQSGFCSAFTALGGKKRGSCESITSLNVEADDQSRKSSVDFDRRSVVTVRRAGSKPALVTRQHSWEAGAQLSSKREYSLSTSNLSPTADDPFASGRSSVQSVEDLHSRSRHAAAGGIYDDDDLAVGNALHKADSFEGHEEAVRSIVAAVQETRTQRRLHN